MAAISVQFGTIQQIHQRCQNPGHDQRREERPRQDAPLFAPVRAAALARQQIKPVLVLVLVMFAMSGTVHGSGDNETVGGEAGLLEDLPQTCVVQWLNATVGQNDVAGGMRSSTFLLFSFFRPLDSNICGHIQNS